MSSLETRKKSSFEIKKSSNSKTKIPFKIKKSIKSKTKKLKKLTKYLKVICNDSGECLAIGHKEKAKINYMFDDFKNFKFAHQFAKRVGKPSSNGFVYEITYSHNGYLSNSLLKSSVNKNSDNLYYEYLVGINFLNKKNNIFPCFTETYQILRNKSNELKKNMTEKKTILMREIENEYEFLNKNEKENIKESCNNSDKLAILVQYLKNPITFDEDFDIIHQQSHESFIDTEIAQLLYQIYGPLSALKEQFTHYDLHPGNILLYELKKNTYINMKYIYGNKLVSFNTRYVAKIIDYGRSFFYENNDNNSKKILEKICQEPLCNYCGEDFGYGWMEIPTTEDIKSGLFEENHFICSSIPNISHDLRFANSIKSMFPGPVDDILNDMVYSNQFGTKELSSNPNSNTINNVIDMEQELKKYILHDEFFKARNQQLYDDDTCIGQLVINMDENKEMLFNPNKSTKQLFLI